MLFGLSFRDAEIAHDITLWILRQLEKRPHILDNFTGLNTISDERLKQEFCGLSFPNPVGLAAGFDKNFVALHALWALLGIGFMEGGTITREKQDGNPRPRMFRLPRDQALINRMGFNNEGADNVAWNLRRARAKVLGIPLGINIGKSKNTPEDRILEIIEDYVYTLEKLYKYGDYFVVNVSSPNTPGLRGLQKKETFGPLMKTLQGFTNTQPETNKPIFVKIAPIPDLTFKEVDDILQVAVDTNVAGIIAANTTLERSELQSSRKEEEGGLSGRPLSEKMLGIIDYIDRQKTGLVLIASGGILNAYDAYRAFRVGANLVQVYTGLIYEGLGLVRDINVGLLELMDRDGAKTISDLRVPNEFF